MKKEFIPYAQSLELKELGFNKPCVGYYENDVLILCYDSKQDYELLLCYDSKQDYELLLNCAAPLYQQAFRWLLDKHYLYGIVLPTLTMNWTFKTMTVVEGMLEVPPYIHVEANDYSTREDAELECLKKLIEIIKNK
jgi:hypothetical protein